MMSRETSEDIIEAMGATRNRIVPSQLSLKTTFSNGGKSRWRHLIDSLTFVSRLQRAKQYRLKETIRKRRWAIVTTVVRVAMRMNSAAPHRSVRPRSDSDCCCSSEVDGTNGSLFSVRNSVGLHTQHSQHLVTTVCPPVIRQSSNGFQDSNALASRKSSQHTVTTLSSHSNLHKNKNESKFHKNRISPVAVDINPPIINDGETISSSSPTKMSLRSLLSTPNFLRLLTSLLICCVVVAVLCSVLS